MWWHEDEKFWDRTSAIQSWKPERPIALPAIQPLKAKPRIAYSPANKEADAHLGACREE